MKIAFFCDAYTPTRNGVAISAATTAEELRRRGHEVTIFAPRYRGYTDQDETVIRFPAMQWFRAKDFALALPILSSKFILPVLHQQEQFFAAQQFDVVHTHSPFTIGTIGARWGKRYGVPVVFTFHTLYHRYLHYAPLPRWYSRPYTVHRVRRHCRFCRHIIAPSRAIARRMSLFHPKSPISIVPTGVRIERFQNGDGARVRARYGITLGELVLLYVGRLGPEKNLDFLLSTLAPLLGEKQGEKQDEENKKQSAPRVRLMIVGGGPVLEKLQNLARQLGISRDVIFTDFVEPQQIPDYFAAGDIFTFASRTETQGVSISEALAAGLPCVVVGALGAAEALQPEINGLVVPPDETAFREAVARLIECEALRRQMAAAARLHAPQLTLDKSVDDLLTIYHGVLA